MIITIDGPVAGGKTTAARNLAHALSFDHLDTGAIFRALTVLARRSGADLSDPSSVDALVSGAAIHFEGDRIFLNGADVSLDIRLPEVSAEVRPLAENSSVRAFVQELDNRFAAGRDVVAEGRDMGTVVFPDAAIKLYLTASVEDRARRRWEELKARNTPQDFETVLADLMTRDRADMTRAISPLRKAHDAIEVDTTGFTEEETTRRLLAIVRQHMRGL